MLQNANKKPEMMLSGEEEYYHLNKKKGLLGVEKRLKAFLRLKNVLF